MAQGATILVVDDDRKLRALLEEYLQQAGYHVICAGDAAQAAELMAQQMPHLLVLDVMMPGVKGTDFAQELRAVGNDVPILMLTAMHEADDRIAGLESGADDYLAKPFEPRELLLRIENLLRRSGMVAQHARFGDYAYDLERRVLKKGEDEVELTSGEASLLGLFARRPNVAISREEIAQALHGISERSVDVQVTRLRKRLEADPANPDYLITVRGEGYMLRA